MSFLPIWHSRKVRIAWRALHLFSNPYWSYYRYTIPFCQLLIPPFQKVFFAPETCRLPLSSSRYNQMYSKKGFFAFFLFKEALPLFQSLNNRKRSLFHEKFNKSFIWKVEEEKGKNPYIIIIIPGGPLGMGVDIINLFF